MANEWPISAIELSMCRSLARKIGGTSVHVPIFDFEWSLQAKIATFELLLCPLKIYIQHTTFYY